MGVPDVDLRGPDGRHQAHHDALHPDALLGQCQGLCAVALRRSPHRTGGRHARHSVLRQCECSQFFTFNLFHCKRMYTCSGVGLGYSMFVYN